MPRLLLTGSASANPMGAQVYQEEISARAASALGPGWGVDRTIVTSLRSPLEGNRRLPMGWLQNASPAARRILGGLLYPRGAVVHRFNLELPPAAGRDVITLHDLVAWTYPDESAPVRAAAEEARRAAAVICVSHATATEAVDRLGIVDPIVVHNGVHERFFDAEPATADELARWGLTPPYVVTAGGVSERKNLAALADAWPLVRSARRDLTLALVGGEHPRRTALFGDLAGTRLVGRVPDEAIPRLLAAAAGVVVPSLHEGFGLPALEGMAVGVPVVATRRSALPEVVGDGGILVEPTPAELAEGILWATSGDSEVADIAERGRRRAAGFTWERSAAGHAAVWARVAQGK